MGKFKKIYFISTYIPRECGIATYTDNLIKAIKSADKRTRCYVVAMNDNHKYKYPKIVKATINQEVDDGYKKVAELINKSDIDLVSVQHEFNIFGGVNGQKILILLKKLRKPIILTLHTVPIYANKPFKIRPRRYKSRLKILKKIIEYVDKVTVMTESAKTFLVKYHNLPSNKVIVIEHGVPNISLKQIANYRRKNKKIIFKDQDFILSTFGLILPKKGLEYVIKAMPGIVAANSGLSIKYFIIGKVHPSWTNEYLNYLKKLTKRLKIKENVIFDTRYLTYSEIYSYLANTNIYISPYYIKELASSGTLAYAIALGRCVVSTPYIFAADVIKNYNVGELVNFQDRISIAKAINKLIKNPKLIKKYEKNSYKFGQSVTWPKIGRKFLYFFNKII